MQVNLILDARKAKMFGIDHLMWACADLKRGIEEISDLTGVQAEYSGQHQGLGTQNALLSLGKDCYLEIIAPDPSQPLENNFGARLKDLTGTGLLAWAVTASDLSVVRKQLAMHDLKTTEPQTTTRLQGDVTLEWQLMYVKGVAHAPFFIDWLDCVHPALTSPKGCKLQSLSVQSPDLDTYRKVFGSIEALTIGNGNSNPSAILQSPTGEVSLTPLSNEP